MSANESGGGDDKRRQERHPVRWWRVRRPTTSSPASPRTCRPAARSSAPIRARISTGIRWYCVPRLARDHRTEPVRWTRGGKFASEGEGRARRRYRVQRAPPDEKVRFEALLERSKPATGGGHPPDQDLVVEDNPRQADPARPARPSARRARPGLNRTASNGPRRPALQRELRRADHRHLHARFDGKASSRRCAPIRHQQDADHRGLGRRRAPAASPWRPALLLPRQADAAASGHRDHAAAAQPGHARAGLATCPSAPCAAPAPRRWRLRTSAPC